ncbi:hypothetical protein Vi05172_g3662 [Venturia inaequalis]|nr:hypothetical protein Vi05172_g3662 [Venturia inaequalis]
MELPFQSDKNLPLEDLQPELYPISQNFLDSELPDLDRNNLILV